MPELEVSALIEGLDRFTEPARRIAQVSEKVAGAIKGLGGLETRPEYGSSPQTRGTLD